MHRPVIETVSEVICRIGSLEKTIALKDGIHDVNCRIGSLEIF